MAKEAAKAGLTRLEMKIMKVIWREGAGTVGEVRAELKPALAYTTVQTMLNILARKGKLRRKLDGRAFVYSAKIAEDKALGQVVRDVVDRIFGGSGEDLVMSLLTNGHIDTKSLARVSKRFNGKNSSSGSRQRG